MSDSFELLTLAKRYANRKVSEAAADTAANIPDSASVGTDGRMVFKRGNTELFAVQLPLYGGESA